MLNALLITNKFYKKDKLLENEKDLAQQKLSSNPAKAAETTETVEAAVQKSLTQKGQNEKSKAAKVSPLIKTMFQKGPKLMSVIAN
jgi:hypothetical protein